MVDQIARDYQRRIDPTYKAEDDMADACPKYVQKKVWTRPVLRKLEGEEAERARLHFMKMGNLGRPGDTD